VLIGELKQRFASVKMFEKVKRTSLLCEAQITSLKSFIKFVAEDFKIGNICLLWKTTQFVTATNLDQSY